LATPPDIAALQADVARLQRKLERERAVRLEAEAIAETGLRDLYNRQRELQTLEAIAARANQGGSLRDVLQFALEEICRFHGWKAGHGYVLRDQGGTPMLTPAGIWFATDADGFKPFRRISSHAEFPTGHGLPGRAYQLGQPIWVADLAEDHNFPRMDIALACGLRSGVAFPVLSGEAVVGVLEFFDTEVRAPATNLLDMLRQAGTQLGRVIERQLAQETLHARAVELARARDEAQAADQAKSAFLAAMSHELRTPLNAIIGFSEIMLDQIAGPLNAEYLDYATDIQKSGVHLKNVINDILDLSKVAVGEMTLREAPVSLATLAENCERIVAPMAKAAQVALACEMAPGLPMLHADETRLQQTMLNLLSNAVKFTPPHGAVRLSIVRAPTGDIVIAVADTGIGMSEEDVALAMEPFRQIDSALSRRYEGTGLGLPLAKAFTELHGGRLEVDSAPGAGTEVRLVLPAARCLRAVA